MESVEPKKAYRFCPKCAGKLVPQKENSLRCGRCHFHLYINPMPTNSVVAENDAGEILLVKRKFPPQKGYWDVPGGFIQPYESFEQSVKREVKEELGVDIVIKKIIGIYTDRYDYEGVIGPAFCIMVAGQLSSFDLVPGDDAEDYAWFTKKDILQQKIAFPSVKKGIADHLASVFFLSKDKKQPLG